MPSEARPPAGYSILDFEPGELERLLSADPFDDVDGIILRQRQGIVRALQERGDTVHGGDLDDVANILDESDKVTWRFPGAPAKYNLKSKGNDDDYDPDKYDGHESIDIQDLLGGGDEDDRLDDEREMADWMWTAWIDRRHAVHEVRRVIEAEEHSGTLPEGVFTMPMAIGIVPTPDCPNVCQRRAKAGPYGIVYFLRDVGLPPYGPKCRCGLTPAMIDDAVKVEAKRAKKASRDTPSQPDVPGWQRCKYDNCKPGFVQVDGPGRIKVNPKTGNATVKSSLTEHPGSYSCETAGVKIERGAPVEQIPAEVAARWAEDAKSKPRAKTAPEPRLGAMPKATPPPASAPDLYDTPKPEGAPTSLVVFGVGLVVVVALAAACMAMG